MNCKKCNAPIGPKEMFCANCGEKNPDYNPNGDNVFSSYDEVPKKKNIVPKAVLGVVAAVVLVGVAFAGVNTVRNMLMAPKDQFRNALKKESESVVSFVGNNIDTVKKRYQSFGDGYTSDGNISLEVTQEGKDMLGMFLPYYMDDDLDWLDSLSIKYKGNISSDAANMDLNLMLNKKDILAANLYMDSEEVQFKIPDISDDVLTLDTQSLESELGYYSSYNLFESMGMQKVMVEAIPDSKQLKKVTDKYIDIAIKNINDVDKSSDTVSAEGVKVKATKLTAYISGDDLAEIKSEILNQMLDDNDLKKIIIDCGDSISDNLGYSSSGEDAYDTFISNVEDAIEYSEYDSFNDMEYSIWLGSGNKVIGKELVVDDETVISYMAPVKGSDLGVEFEAGYGGDSVKFSGEGKVKGSSVSGKFVLEADGESINFDVKKLDFKKLSKGEIDMDVDFSMGGYYGIGGYSLGVKANGNEKKVSVVFDVKSGGKSLVRLTVDETVSKGKAPKELSGKKLSADNYSDISDYIDDADIDNLIKKLKKSDLPSEYVEMIESSFGY